MTATSLPHQEIALVSVLKACTKNKNLHKGCTVHADVIKRGFLQTNVYVGSAVINMYAKCGALAKGQEVFDELGIRSVVSWNTLIAGYTQHGHGEDVLHCFEEMKGEGILPNSVTFLCVLKACGGLRAAHLGTDIHAEIMRQSLLGRELALGNALVDMYAKCGALVKVQEVFDKLPRRNQVTWNSLIGGYAQHGHGDRALDAFNSMQEKGLLPNEVSFLGVLKACGSMRSTKKGIDIHADILRQGLLEKHSMLGNALVDMYAKCGALPMAQEVFEKLPSRDVVTWNALLTGYCQHGHSEEALIRFEQMQRDGPSPNAMTFTCILQACGSVGDTDKGKEIHEELLRQGLLEEDGVLCTALVDMYVKCGELVKAQHVFDELCDNDIISWTTLILGYCQHGYGEEALHCLEKMKRKGLCPDGVTFTCILKACSTLGAAGKGEVIHAEIVSEGLYGKKDEIASVWSALVDLYVKCGDLPKAQEVFDRLPVRDVISWTALMSGYARVGKYNSVFSLFERMSKEGVEPNSVTFVVVLNVCSYLGLVDEGSVYFNRMCTRHGIMPTLEHYICMVDLFGRTGHFDKAMGMIKEMPSSDCIRVWFTLLGACKKWGNVELARWAFEHAVQLDENFGEVYAYMASIYATAGMQREADKIRLMRLKIESGKQPGGCLVD